MPPGDVLDRIHVEVAFHEYAALQGGKITQEAADRLSEQLRVHLLADARAIWYAFLQLAQGTGVFARLSFEAFARAETVDGRRPGDLGQKRGKACGR